MKSSIKEVLIDEVTLNNRISEMSVELVKEYADKNPLVICILKGSVLFFTDIIRKMDIRLEIDFLKASSYGKGTRSPGKVQMDDDLSIEARGRHVLIIEDIVDSGNTLQFIYEYFQEKDAASVKICTLLDKPDRRVVDVEVDYTCFEIPDEFVVGYGLDYAEEFRNLPYVGVLDESYYNID